MAMRQAVAGLASRVPKASKSTTCGVLFASRETVARAGVVRLASRLVAPPSTSTGAGKRRTATALLGGAALAAGSWAATDDSAIQADGSGRQRTFIMVKPDGMQRGLAAKVLARFEDRGFQLVAARVLVPTKEHMEEHYAEHKGRPFYPGLCEFMSSGPVLAMVFEGDDVVSVGRLMIGKTKPVDSPPGTIRGDHGVTSSSFANVVHGSDSLESAEREIQLWFPDQELAEW